VPLVIGTDAGNWPMVPYQFHGPSTLREIEVLGEAGLAPADAIAAATRVPAAMLRLSDEIGTVEVGKRADLLVVREGPARRPARAPRHRVGREGRRGASAGRMARGLTVARHARRSLSGSIFSRRMPAGGSVKPKRR
jgi:imidazolonepropionase-like amidohydrolase